MLSTRGEDAPARSFQRSTQAQPDGFSVRASCFLSDALIDTRVTHAPPCLSGLPGEISKRAGKRGWCMAGHVSVDRQQTALTVKHAVSRWFPSCRDEGRYGEVSPPDAGERQAAKVYGVMGVRKVLGWRVAGMIDCVG